MFTRLGRGTRQPGLVEYALTLHSACKSSQMPQINKPFFYFFILFLLLTILPRNHLWEEDYINSSSLFLRQFFVLSLARLFSFGGCWESCRWHLLLISAFLLSWQDAVHRKYRKPSSYTNFPNNQIHAQVITTDLHIKYIVEKKAALVQWWFTMSVLGSEEQAMAVRKVRRCVWWESRWYMPFAKPL